jgi:hypothetical protein
MRKLVEALAPGGLLVTTYSNLVSDDPDQTGFDWPGQGFGAKAIGDGLSRLGGDAGARTEDAPLPVSAVPACVERSSRPSWWSCPS